MGHSETFLILAVFCAFWMLAHSFDPKEGYPRSKYSRKRGEPRDVNTMDEPNKQLIVESDFVMHYECGAQTAENHPWIVVIEHSDPSERTKRKTLSKGVLIGPQHVLTTVSSIHNSHPFWVVSGVRLGDSPTWAIDTIEHNTSNVVHRGIDQVYMHEDKDIALIRLSQPVRVTDNIQPICLPKHGHYEFRELYLHVCKRIKGIPLKKQARIIVAQVATTSPSDCHIFYRRNGAQLTKEEFCAWDETGDTCTGDLGGPLIGKHNGRFYVIGLKSYALSATNLENIGLPGVYTKVGSHIKWIRHLMNNNV